ncbi:MAG: ABC transporter substrate-binding protein [Caldilineaceae bacterium]|nr:ABC transporter substrate-binding protein [Caldilineaceae bacterium]
MRRTFCDQMCRPMAAQILSAASGMRLFGERVFGERVFGVLLILTLLLAGCGQGLAPLSEPADANAGEEGLTPVKLGVGFVPNVQFAPFYVGIEQGFYAEEGLDVSLEYGFENDYLKLVGTGDIPFMIGSGDQVVLGRAQGLPVRYVMNWYTRFPVVIFAKSEAEIATPADLAGKRVGIPGPFGASYVALRGILQVAGLDESDIQMESIGFTQAAAISEGLVDAAVDYGVNGPVVLAQEGIDTTQISLDDHLRLPANGLVTSESLLTENPELVKKMVRTTLKSIQYTLDNPDEAFEIALQAVPEADGDNRAANRAVFDAVLDYWQPLASNRLGESQTADWQAVVKLMQASGLVAGRCGGRAARR